MHAVLALRSLSGLRHGSQHQTRFYIKSIELTSRFGQITSGVFFNMGNMVMAHWFKRRLGLAIACAFGGAGAGGCIFPIIVRALLHRVRYAIDARLEVQFQLTGTI